MEQPSSQLMMNTFYQGVGMAGAKPGVGFNFEPQSDDDEDEQSGED